MKTEKKLKKLSEKLATDIDNFLIGGGTIKRFEDGKRTLEEKYDWETNNTNDQLFEYIPRPKPRIDFLEDALEAIGY